MNKLVAVLSVIAISAVALSVWLIKDQNNDEISPNLLFADLQTYAHQIENVEIRNGQGVLFNAHKLSDSWLATFDAEQDVYPISQDKLANFIATLMTAKLVEAKTKKPENYSRLGLQAIDADDSLATQVVIKGANKTWQLLVGNKVSASEGQYILKPNDQQSWRTDKTIRLPMDKFSWLKQPILPYVSKDITSVSRIDGENWQIVRAQDNSLQLANMPKNKELQYQGILGSIINNITSLDFERLLPIQNEFAQTLKLLTQLEVSTADNHIFQVVVSGRDDKYFVNFSANNQTEYWQNWYYQISHFSAQQLIKTLDEFLATESTEPTLDSTNQQHLDEGDSPH